MEKEYVNIHKILYIKVILYKVKEMDQVRLDIKIK